MLVGLLQKHREQSYQEQTLPSVSPWELSSGWGTLGLPVPDILLSAKRQKPVVAIWDYPFPALPHKGAGGRKGVQIMLFGTGTLTAQSQGHASSCNAD